MAKNKDLYGIDAVTQFYEQIANSPSMKAVREFMNSPAAHMAQKLVNSPEIQAAVQYVNNPGYQGAVQQVSILQKVLDQMQPAYLKVPLYNAAAISTMNQTAGIEAQMQKNASMIQSILPDMSVLNSIADTVSTLNPAFKSVQGVIDRMKPLWENGIIHEVNPEAIWPCMENEESLNEELKDDDIDRDTFSEDVTELLDSDHPEEAVAKFQNKWRKISKSVFGVITWAALTIAAGKIQYEMQPLYQNTPHLSFASEQTQIQEMSENQIEFAVFCIENVAIKLGISGDEAYQLLTKENNVLDEYIITNYEILHTQDKE